MSDKEYDQNLLDDIDNQVEHYDLMDAIDSQIENQKESPKHLKMGSYGTGSDCFGR